MPTRSEPGGGSKTYLVKKHQEVLEGKREKYSWELVHLVLVEH
jgi:hypothetical protein